MKLKEVYIILLSGIKCSKILFTRLILAHQAIKNRNEEILFNLLKNFFIAIFSHIILTYVFTSFIGIISLV